MLEANKLTKHFGATAALDSVDLRVDPGDIYCLLGANGAGKTTLILRLAQLQGRPLYRWRTA